MTLERATIGRLNARIVPLFLATYIVNFLDRVNVGFASLQMNERLDFSDAVYGFGAGIFFIGYFLFEVPSNMVLARVGPRYWLARIMVTWGIVSVCTALVSTPTEFYVARFLLGVAEAGFVPALLVYINSWYPEHYRAGTVATIWSATAIAIVIGGPISGVLLGLDGVAGLQGWQWMFVVEAVPAVLLGVALLALMTDRPDQATWLTAEQRNWLTERLAAEEARKQAGGARHSLGAAFSDPRVWVLGLLYFCLGVGFFGITLWLAQVVRQMSGLSDIQTSFVSAIPFAAATVAMIAAGRWSDRTGRRTSVVVGGCLVAAAGFAASGQVASPVLALTALALGAMGLWSVIGVFWQLPTQFLSGAAAAIGVAIINSCGSLGGFVGPYTIGWMRGAGDDFGSALLGIAAAMIAAAVIAGLLAHQARKEPTPKAI